MAVSPVVRVPVKQDGHSHGVRERLARCWDGDSGFWLPIACSVVRQTRRARFKLWAWALQAHRLLGEDVSSSFLVASLKTSNFSFKRNVVGEEWQSSGLRATMS